MVLLQVMQHLQVVVVMLAVVVDLVVEELLLFMQEHTPTMDLLRVVVVLLVKVVLTLKEVVELQNSLVQVVQEQLLLFRLMLQYNIKV
jgi:hypothetical protein